MSEPVRDRWLSIGMSVLLHGAVIALLAVGWLSFRRPAPAPTLSINATVVDARTLKGMGIATQTPRESTKPAVVHATPAAQPSQAAQPPPPAPPAPQGPPQPTPDELAMRAQAAKEEAAHQAQAEQRLLAQQQARQQAEQAEEEAQRKAAAQAAAQQAAAAKKAKAEKLAEAKKLAAAKKAAEAKKLAAQRQAEADRAARIADLQQSLNEEERAAAASGALASWRLEISSRIQHAWIRPPTAQRGLDCVLNLTQVAGGSVTDVTIGQCNGDEAVRESIEAAVYRASPLPPPPDPSLFQSQLIIEFKPIH